MWPGDGRKGRVVCARGLLLRGGGTLSFRVNATQLYRNCCFGLMHGVLEGGFRRDTCAWRRLLVVSGVFSALMFAARLLGMRDG